MGFGGSPAGSTPLGSGGGALVLEAEQVTTGSVRVALGGQVPIENRAAVWDALYDRGWRLELRDNARARVPHVVWVERDPEHARSVILHLDAELEGPGRLYRVIGSSAIFGAGGREVGFRSFGPGRPTRVQERRGASFDLANVQVGGDGPGITEALGTLQIDADGDYRSDSGLENIKKRVIRRLTTPVGSFAHLPDYGMRLPIKQRITAGTLRDLQAQAIRQVRLELGVTDVRVGVSAPLPGIVVLDVEAEAHGARVGVSVQLGL